MRQIARLRSVARGICLVATVASRSLYRCSYLLLGDASEAACRCDQTGECHCCTIRTPYSGRKPKARDSTTSVTPERGQPQSLATSPVDIVGAALANGQRPLLPKPMEQQHVFVPAAPVLPPGHASGSNLQLDLPPPHSCCSGPSTPPPIAAGHPYVAPFTPQEGYLSNTAPPSSHAYTPDLNAWLAMFSPLTPVEEPAPAPPPSSWTVDSFSLCECGAGCSCPGCPEHGNSSSNGSASCSGPNGDTCSSCLDCALVSVPPPQANHPGVQESGHSPLDFTVGEQEAPSYGLQSFNIHSQQDLFLPPTLVMPDSTK